MSKLLDKLAKASTSEYSSRLTDSAFFKNKDVTVTDMPILNLAFSGELTGGFRSGLTTIAGPSKHFKSNLALYAVRSYMRKNPDAVCLYYDSEFGSPPEYFDSFGIDVDRVLHVPVVHIEQLKFDTINQLKNISRGEKVITFIDSIGNLASKKEATDAENQKSAADMTRAAQLKSLYRIITPYFTIQDIPGMIVNHTYMSQDFMPKAVMSGGQGPMLSSDNVFIVGRRQEKEGKDLTGYEFIINIEKSRTVREKSKFSFSVSFDHGIDKWSGLLDLALDSGHVEKSGHSYVRKAVDDQKWKKKETSCREFWQPVLEDESFRTAVSDRFKLSSTNMVSDEEEASA